MVNFAEAINLLDVHVDYFTTRKELVPDDEVKLAVSIRPAFH